MLCVECGTETEPGPLCPACAAIKRKRPPMPEYIDIVVCSTCGASLQRAGWVDVELEETVEAFLTSMLRKQCDLTSVRVKLEQIDDKNYLAKVNVYSETDGEKHKDPLTSHVRVQSGTCDTCGRMSGNYFESIVQLRAEGRALDQEEREFAEDFVERKVGSARAKDRTVFLSKTEEVKGGMDFYLSSNPLGQAIGRELADRMGARFSMSNELYGQKNGKEIFRMTFLVRLPPYWQGAFVLYKDRLAEVVNIGSKRTVLRMLDSWAKEDAANKDLTGLRVVGGREMGIEGVVLAETDKEVQLLDPENSRVVEVVKPAGWKREGETARFIKYDDGAYLL